MGKMEGGDGAKEKGEKVSAGGENGAGEKGAEWEKEEKFLGWGEGAGR